MEPSLSEQIKDAGYERCSLCDHWQPDDDLLMMAVDAEAPLVRQPVCGECQMTLEQAA